MANSPMENNPNEKPMDNIDEDIVHIEGDIDLEKPEIKKSKKKKGISKGKYNLLYFGSIIVTVLVVAVIVIDLITGVNPARALFTGEWSSSSKDKKDDKKPITGVVTPEKSNFDKTMDFAEFSLQYFKKAFEEQGDKEIKDLSEEGAKGSVLTNYSKGISSFYQTQMRWYTVNLEQIRDLGYEKGDLVHQTDNKLTKLMVKLEKYVEDAKNNSDLDYVFSDRGIRNAQNQVEALKESYLNLAKKFRPKTPQDLLEGIADEYERTNDKRAEVLSSIRGLFMDISDVKKDDEKYKEMQIALDEEGKKFFRHCWMTLAKYYKYMKYAMDNELTPDEITMKSAKKIEDSTFSWVEGRLKEFGVNVDRNTEFAEDVRLKVEELKKEVGNYGTDKDNAADDDNTPEENKGYADDDKDSDSSDDDADNDETPDDDKTPEDDKD
ncbi:MAG: hypothetical protein K8S87_07325 [Planctomycetes bacterium]|nr:hypothetical protein [Planctomycetota bacterium]